MQATTMWSASSPSRAWCRLFDALAAAARHARSWACQPAALPLRAIALQVHRDGQDARRHPGGRSKECWYSSGLGQARDRHAAGRLQRAFAQRGITPRGQLSSCRAWKRAVPARARARRRGGRHGAGREATPASTHSPRGPGGHAAERVHARAPDRRHAGNDGPARPHRIRRGGLCTHRRGRRARPRPQRGDAQGDRGAPPGAVRPAQAVAASPAPCSSSRAQSARATRTAAVYCE